jgi:hypothetical protein
MVFDKIILAVVILTISFQPFARFPQAVFLQVVLPQTAI